MSQRKKDLDGALCFVNVEVHCARCPIIIHFEHNGTARQAEKTLKKKEWRKKWFKWICPSCDRASLLEGV